jgi:CBS domain-containing protein
MLVEDIIKAKGNEVFTVAVDAAVNDAMAVMNEKRIGALVVVDGGGRIRGILSERDIIRQCYACQHSIKNRPVGELMTPREELVVCCLPDDIEAVMSSMTEKRIRHVPVVGADESLQGMISIGDVIKSKLVDKEFRISRLQEYILGNPTGGVPSAD